MFYLEKLNSFIGKEKPYMNPDLNLPQLAKEVDIPSQYLSRIINENIGLNFFDFINHQRVEDVKSKI